MLLLASGCVTPGAPVNEEQAALRQEKTMSNADSAGASPRGPTLRERLPSILGLWIDRVSFEPPKLKFVKSAREDVPEVIAFELKLDGPLPVHMDATPVLYVGSQAISHAEQGEDGRVRFLAFPDEWEQLEVGAPIALGWPGVGPEEHRKSKYRYEPPPSKQPK